jgi:hypothetical protein
MMQSVAISVYNLVDTSGARKYPATIIFETVVYSNIRSSVEITARLRLPYQIPDQHQQDLL